MEIENLGINVLIYLYTTIFHNSCNLDYGKIEGISMLFKAYLEYYLMYLTIFKYRF